jgi:mannose-6-phosphate isomerase
MSASAEMVRTWLTETALPLWSDVGVDPRGGFVECLTLDGRPDIGTPKRLLVQARQIYVFSHAQLMGLRRDAVETAWSGYLFTRRHAWTPDGGCVHLLAHDGAVLSTRRDLYDHAFFLFALAWLYRATGESEVRRTIEATVRFLDLQFAHPSGDGYREDLSDALPRRQNPHMHLLEAWLALFEATHEESYLVRAQNIHRLFQRAFFDRSCNVLREYFTDDLRALNGDSDFFEPGHHFEWVWLLHRYARLSGEPVAPEAAALLATAGRCGISQHHLVLDEVWTSGNCKRGSARCWPQTEALKAVCVGAGLDGKLAPDAIVSRLFAHHLSGPVPGSWWDRVDEQLNPCVDKVPATTFYHLFLAFAEYLSGPQSS